MKIKLLYFFFLISFFHLNAQQFQYSAEVNSEGLFFSKETSPFWLHSNQRGRIDEKTNISGWLNASAKYYLSNTTYFELGAGGLYQDGFTDEFQLDESYVSFNTILFSVIAGRKQKPELYRGLSATNQNILWSLNARPLPGLQVYTPEPVFLNGKDGVGFKASLAEYLTDDERYVDDTRIHHKSLHLVYKASGKFQITAGLQHFVQWGGTSPDFGKLPAGFDDYLNIFTGKEGDDSVDGQEANALGNHLGSYEIYLDTQLAGYKVQLLYNHLFEDGSGRVLRNTPDGRYGIYIEDIHQEKWVTALMYELYYTKNQSAASPTSDGRDNYFNNNLYRSGWTYENRILGVPFITLDEDRFRVANNTVLVHHLGISGKAWSNFPYKLLLSYRKNYGVKGGSAAAKNNILSTYLDVELFRNVVDLNLLLGSDFISDDSPNFGVGVRLSRKLL
ncbi:capsule assembly Wzi family protein [Salegentibacter chungangensis]|uniref:Capsule assembly Wzi family protein n=1 Tax=Salegentibacter chungangensis TaxID=1335724 RepID=A0ABW3NUV2_9FLAO